MDRKDKKETAVCICNPSIQKAEVGGSEAQGQHGLYSKTLSLEKRNLL
jgi:hypothetical protein